MPRLCTQLDSPRTGYFPQPSGPLILVGRAAHKALPLATPRVRVWPMNTLRQSTAP
ncbi:hypothetical protein Pen02_33250 [Plantactinospora endophytica]|uniref:Uncharacterized protein n=1 Tax=Plantactinospora endophytica TaxID=673535 RepID=A0ABQ4E0Z2_9ACTN|nr:hypothetical protein Pen02_33250 [Plantactinospora endophytica]